MNKHENDILPQISRRYSPLSFTDQKVDEAQLLQIFKAAGKASSSYNSQPWRFVYALRKDGKNFGQLLGSLVEANKEWASSAQALILILARKTYKHNGNLIRTSQYETGMAVGNMVVQAMEFGIFIHQMGGFDRDALRETLNIPLEFEIIAIAAAGYPGDPAKLSPSLKKRAEKPQVRMAVNEFAFSAGEEILWE